MIHPSHLPADASALRAEADRAARAGEASTVVRCAHALVALQRASRAADASQSTPDAKTRHDRSSAGRCATCEELAIPPAADGAPFEVDARAIPGGWHAHVTRDGVTLANARAPSREGAALRALHAALQVSAPPVAATSPGEVESALDAILGAPVGVDASAVRG